MAQVERGRLEIEQVVPYFCLPSLQGGQVSPRDYKQKCNLVLAYLDPSRCSQCGNLLREFADNHQAYRDLETEIVAICPQPVEELQQSLGAAGLPFPVLSDQQGEVSRAYLGCESGSCPVAAIFVTDRFGALRTKMIADSESDLPNQQSILDWLSLIEMECPECGR